MIEIQQREDTIKTTFINSIETALFGEFNAAQIKDFPTVRIFKSYWLSYTCYQPVISNDQQHQAAILGSENNPMDECLRLTVELLNVQDV